MKFIFLIALVLLVGCNFQNNKIDYPDPGPPGSGSGSGGSSNLPPPEAYTYLDQTFVTSCNSPSPTNGVFATPEYGYVSYVSEIACVAADLSNATNINAPFYRYLTFSDVYNTNGVNDIFNRLETAANKGINSVSFIPVISPIVFIGNPPVVARIDLRNYSLTANQWETLLLPIYPYATRYFESQFVASDLSFIQQASGSQWPFLRADWFLDQTQQPPLYWEILNLPNDANDFLKLLNVPEDTDILNFQAQRAAIRHSGVANWNRLIDWYPIQYDSGGVQNNFALMRTFDVLDQESQDFKNFFEFPFGPNEADVPSGTNDHPFAFDASEWIYSLPNGLDGYFFSDGKGNRIDEALTGVATDHANNSPYIGSAPFVVRAGVSCMHCHSNGFNGFTDELKASANGSPFFSQTDIDFIAQLFPDASQMNSLLAQHNSTFASSLGAVASQKSISSALSNDTEPVFWSVRWYLEDLDLAQAASELGISVPNFQSCMLHEPALAAELGLSDPVNGTIQRQEWELHVGDAMNECDVGEQIKFVVTPPPAPPVCHFTILNDTPDEFDFTLGNIAGQLKLASEQTFTATVSGNTTLNAVFDDGVIRSYNISDCASYTIEPNALVTNSEKK